MKVAIKPMTPGVPPAARIRAYLAGAVVSLGLLGVAVKAWALQVDEGDKYRALADRQHAMQLAIPAPRGEVIDLHGRPLAISADADSVWANPREVRDVASTAERLATLIHGDARLFEEKLAGDRRFVWLERHVTPDIAKAVRAAKLPGIEVAKEPRRWYPAKTIAGPVIGRADIDGNGLDGIELAMNDLLRGRRGAVKALRDARGRKMLADGGAPAEPGASVRLTLDRSIQAIADDTLTETVITNKAKNGVAVVLEVATGHVLAMASYPTFDPNSPTSIDVHGARNRPVTDAYEAGSVMKVFSVVAALEAGVVKPETGFVTLPYKVGPKLITDTHANPYLNVSDIIKHSSNIGASKIALRLGREKLYAYLKQFGFGAKSGIELPGEQPGRLRDGSTWRDVELATIAYGYGLTVTPLQIAAALAAIGNDGIYHQPRIVDEVVDGDGTVLYRGASEQRQMISSKHAAEMRKMLASVFDKGKFGGTANGIDVEGFRCGGKTGTAYKYDPAIKHYSTDRYLSSFAGLAPIDHPRLAIVVMIDDPGGGEHYGGKVAAPAFAKIASQALRYLGVPGQAIVPTDAAGKPIAKLPEPVAIVPVQPEPDDAEPDPAAVMIPDFSGMGLSRALDEARKLHLDVEVAGSGIVIEQDPGAGPVVNPTRLRLQFSDDIRRTSAAARP
jgi:cell division protein FtsI (penicillin-binding protein 3)